MVNTFNVSNKRIKKTKSKIRKVKKKVKRLAKSQGDFFSDLQGAGL